MVELEYVGSIRIASQEDEERLAAIRAPFFATRVGNFVQVFGPPGTRADFRSKVALRDRTLLPLKRDQVLLLKDTKFICHELTHLVREFTREKEIPDVKLNGVQNRGHGHFLEVRDTFRNESLFIYVVADAENPEEWVTWRLVEENDKGQEVSKEGTESYPEDYKDFDEEAERTKVVNKIFTQVKKWMKDRG